MVRTPEYRTSPELRQAWDEALAPYAEAALANFRTWPLLERVGEPWPDAPSRFTPVASLIAVGKGLSSKQTQELLEAANPGLRAMYFNLSEMLNVREAHLDKVWERRIEGVVLRATRAALATLGKRTGWRPGKNEEGS